MVTGWGHPIDKRIDTRLVAVDVLHSCNTALNSYWSHFVAPSVNRSADFCPLSFLQLIAGSNGRGAPRTAMPDLSAWFDDESSSFELADFFEEITQEQLPGLVNEIWMQHDNTKWFSLLGAGLLSMASRGNAQAVEQLLSAGARLDAQDRAGFTALHRASSFGHIDVVHHLLHAESQRNAWGPNNQPRLVFQAGQGCTRLVPAATVMMRGNLNTRDYEGCFPLHRAAASGNARVVDLLLENGASATKPNDAYKTPLHYAARSNDDKGIETIVRYGGDVMARDNAGRTPLHDAALEGTETSTRALVRAEADMEARGCISGQTPLHEACAAVRPDIVRLLLSLGANESAVDNDGYTPSGVVGECANGDGNEIREEDIRGMLARAPAERRWLRRRMLLLLRRRAPLPVLGMHGMDLSQVDMDLWLMVRDAVDLEEGVFRDVVMFL